MVGDALAALPFSRTGIISTVTPILILIDMTFYIRHLLLLIIQVMILFKPSTIGEQNVSPA
jgi:hypothetical protein